MKQYIWYVPKLDQLIIRSFKTYKEINIPVIRSAYKNEFIFIGEL